MMNIREFIEAAPQSCFRIWYEDNIHYAVVIHQVDYTNQEMIISWFNSEDDLTIQKKNKNIVLPLDYIYDASLNIDSSQKYPIDKNASTEKASTNNQQHDSQKYHHSRYSDNHHHQVIFVGVFFCHQVELGFSKD